jgi:2-polyprenyl-6-methoxyphenol hydroxylase-like FAD-dependent oxidoreductase
MIALHRGDLQAVLHEDIAARVTFDRELSSIEEEERRVVLRFASGDEARHDLVVGADGLRSAARAHVVGGQPTRYSGYTCWRGVCETPAGWRGPVGEYWGVGDRLGVVEIGQGRLYWFAVADAPEGTPGPGSNDKAALLERFGGYAFDGPKVIEATPEADILHHDICDRPPARGWARGRVVLLGDAAHPTTPNMGQGAAMAIEDAAVLARALEDDDVERALARYEETRFARAKFVTSTSWTVGRMAHAKNPVMRALRNKMFAWMPMKMRLKQIDKVAGYDARSAPLASSSSV